MADNELEIKIVGDAKSAQDAILSVEDSAATLDRRLKTLSEIASSAFKVLSGSIVDSLKAFEEADAASRKLTQSLQVQGIYTAELAEKYKGYANELERTAGLDADAIISSQATAQSFLGQTEITQELTNAIADLAQAKGIDLNAAATILAKTIGTGTNALAREGLEISKTATEAQKYAQVLAFVEGKYKGQAVAANQGLGSLRGLHVAFENLQESIGERLAPAAEKLIGFLTQLFQTLSENELLADVAAGMLAAGAAIAGIGVVIPGVILGFSAMSTAAAALGLSVSVAFLGIPILIGLVVAALTFLATNWDETTAYVTALTTRLVTFVTEAFSGLEKVLNGAMHFNLEEIEAGLGEVSDAFEKSVTDAAEILPKKTKEATSAQNAILKEAAAERHQIELEAAALRGTIADQEQELRIAKIDQASAAEVQALNERLETLKALQSATDEEEKADLAGQLVFLNALRSQFAKDNAAAEESEAAITKAVKEKARADGFESDNVYYIARQQALVNALKSEAQVEAEISEERTKSNVDKNNKKLEDQKKYGKAYAAINTAVHSDEVDAVKSGVGELVGLQNSKNEVLRAIGKAAAITQIGIKTAESAMNVYASFSVIPFVGIPLGIAAAAAVVAFGAEQVADVVAAADGGIATGGLPGKDSIPFLLSPGELVVPQRNFEEVVGATRDARSGTSSRDAGGSQQATGGAIEIELSMKNELVDFIEARLIQRERLGTSLRTATA